MKGSIKVGWATEDDGCEFEYLSDKNPRVLKIPLVCIMVIKIRAWFNFTYYVTQKYDPSDEHRKPIDFLGKIGKLKINE